MNSKVALIIGERWWGQWSRNSEEKTESRYQNQDLWGWKLWSYELFLTCHGKDIYEWSFFSWRQAITSHTFLWRDTLNNKQHKWVKVGHISWTFLMVRVKMALARTNHVCLCDFLFVFGSCLLSDPFFGHEVWPNYTGLQCLVSNACDGKHVYIVFFYTILLHFFIGFWKKSWTLFS